MIDRKRIVQFSMEELRWSRAGWRSYLVLLPFFTAVVVLAVFFFVLFAALLALAAAGIGLRLWWLRRKLGKAASGQTFDGKYRVIERHSEIIEHRRRGEADP